MGDVLDRAACADDTDAPPQPAGWYARFGKRTLDVLVAASALILLAPVLLAVAGAVRLRLGSPVLFRQERPGRDGRVFTMYKFRSMTDRTDGNGELLPDSARLTGFGRWLRASSLDELPEFFNILRGDMSLVGPRPLALDYVPHYTAREWCRHRVRPGLTGLAQVNGRNATTWEERFEYDLEYVSRLSFLTDVSIVLRTVGTVLGRSGVGVRGVSSLDDFDEYRSRGGRGEPS